MSGSLIAVPVVSLLAICLLHAVWASPAGQKSVPVDVEILLDASAYIKKESFDEIKKFVKSFVEDFDVGPNGLNMGVISFAGKLRVHFSLNSYTTTSSLLAAIDRIQYLGGDKAHMEESLRLVRQKAFTKANGDREDAPNILILVVDGRTANWESARKEIAELRKTNISIFVVNFNDYQVTHEMYLIASKEQYIFHVSLSDLDAMENLHFNLTDAVSEEVAALLHPEPAATPSPSPTPDPRLLKADVVFLLETSSYMTEEKFTQGKSFMKAFAGEFNIDPNGLNLGVITYDESAYREFLMNKYTTSSSLLAAIDRIRFRSNGLSPHLAPALRRARKEAFTEANGDRPDVPNILILFGDGRARDVDSIIQEKAKLNQTDIRIYCVSFYRKIAPLTAIIASRMENNFFVTPGNDLNSRVQLTKAVSEEIAALLPPEPTQNTTSSYPIPNENTTSSYSKPNEITTSSYLKPNENTTSSYSKPNENTTSSYPIPNENTTSSYSKPNATTPPSYALAPLYFHPQPPCVDSITSCAEYGFSHCNLDSLWAQYICRRHCGVCVQHCDYKGQWYSHGAQWQDGCAYVCECVDGATGHYQCYNKCPTYLYLLPHCTLVQLPGLCCLQPVCDFGAVYQTVGGQNAGHLNGHQVCVYNGAKHHQSQRWTVGCDLECFCYDASIGLYTCHSKCAQYGMLPSSCKLVKKTGECCPEPECEFYTTMGPIAGVGQPIGNGQNVYTVFTF